jgi:hypothetical protein
MTENSIPKEILHTKMEGKRPREKPRSRWIDKIRKDRNKEKWDEM